MKKVKKGIAFTAVMLLAIGLVFVGCDTGNGGGDYGYRDV